MRFAEKIVDNAPTAIAPRVAPHKSDGAPRVYRNFTFSNARFGGERVSLFD